MNHQQPELRIEDVGRGARHLIEANAGTGKTYAIANLFLRFVLEEIRVQNLLVVTFTTAATDELRGRIRRRLNEARQMLVRGEADGDADPFFRALPERFPAGAEREAAIRQLELALLEIGEAPIHTIHGFCQQALTARAFGSGQAFDMEQTDDDELKRRALQDWWRQRTYGLSAVALDSFLAKFPNFKTLQGQLKTLLKVPAPELHPASDPHSVRKEIEEELKQLAQLWLEQGTEACGLMLEHKALSRTKGNGRKKEELKPALELLDGWLRQQPPTVPDLDLLQLIAHDRLVFKKTGKNKSGFDREPFFQAKRLLTALEGLQQSLIIHELTEARAFVVDQLATIKQRQGLLSFDDMIERLHQALIPASDASDHLAQELAEAYPVILVDEFQDTDALQYAIFSRIHAASPEHTLIMIGDPKQAIYGFRGGDIFTYMQARRETGNHWSLATNWRSTPEMIGAVNTLFAGDNSFTYAEIPYEPSQPAPETQRGAAALTLDGAPLPALIVQNLPRKENGSQLTNKDEVYGHVHQAVAGRIAELLGSGTAFLGERPLRPADIAILVRTGDEAVAVRQALMARGVRAVSTGRESIWKSAEAEGLRRLLEAALQPGERSLLRQALAAPFLGLGAGELHTMISDPDRWSNWVELFQETGAYLARGWFMPAFQILLQGLAPALTPAGAEGTAAESGWLAKVQDPERTLTNLLHLADLLQQASREHQDGERLLAWMHEQQHQEQNEENELRLESDEALVKILTIHASKGLEFPVVFVPYLWRCRPADQKENHSMSWHEPAGDGFRHCYTPWLDREVPIIRIADHERLAEDIRLAYVALTRAAAHCHLFFGAFGTDRVGHAGRTALAWLLSERNHDLDTALFRVDPAAVDIQALAEEPYIALLPPQQDLTPHSISTGTPSLDTLRAASFTRRIRGNWRIGSYSAMTRDLHQATHVPKTPVDGDFALTYPASARIGSFLHALLEHLEPDRPLEPQLRQLLPSFSLRYGLKPEEQDPAGLAGWIHDILHTPLDGGDLTLAGLNPARTLRELEFDLGTHEVDCQRLNTLLCREGDSSLPPLQFDNFQGMVNGVIDLVFEHAGRYYLADYKSTRLGYRLEDYRPEKLATEIDERRYDLQYLLYTVALHRHLRQRLRDYDYERDFGGVYYLFLRAMRPDIGSQYGVYHRRPDAALVKRLDLEIFTAPLENIA